MDPIIFDMQFVKALDIDVTAVLKQSLYGGGTVFEAAMKVKPIQVSQRDHLIHCAVVKTIVDRYRIANNDIVRFWKTCQNVLNRIVMRTPMTFGRDGLLYTTSNGIALLNGMSIQYHQLRKENRNLRYLSNEKKKEYVDIYGGKCTENIVQGLSRIVIGEQMLTLAPDMRIVSTTHDEIITIAREQDAEDTYDRMSEVMTIPPDWAPDLPLAAEGGFHECYGLCEK